jgi:hypothetical protein
VPDPNPARGERRILHEEPGAPQPRVGLPAIARADRASSWTHACAVLVSFVRPKA